MPVDDLIEQTIALPRGELRVVQPREGAELADDGPVEWAPLSPYWSVLWRSGVALARELGGRDLAGTRVIELGCGLGAPSLAAAQAGASVLATDAAPEALELVAASARVNEVDVATARVEWARAGELGRFDLAVGADVLYERGNVGELLSLLPRLAGEVLIADPGRPAADAFLAAARERWAVDERVIGVVRIWRLSATV